MHCLSEENKKTCKAMRASIINLCNQIAEIFPLCCKGSFMTGCLIPGKIAHKLQLITFTTHKKKTDAEELKMTHISFKSFHILIVMHCT